MLATIVLVLTALAFAWSMGAHYTGACMGMPYATKSIALRPALGLMAAMTLIGAAFLSHKVLVHVGHGILTGQLLVIPAIIVIGVAFLLTTAFTQLRIPTSTIQILIFALGGAGLALGLGINWLAILHLVVLWVLAPFIACGLGFLFTKLFDHVPWSNASESARLIGQALVLVGGVASLTMGANDVSNATAVFLTVHFSGPLLAGLIGGLGLAVGILTWGRPILERVAGFDVVKMDMKMATAAQLVQALVVLTAVAFGYFTSMNQALIGAMAGTGLARGRQTIDRKVMFGIGRGWIIGPGAGFILAYVGAWVYRAILGG
ncbi:inorganic phosphate transporter [Acidiphilium sp. 34-64-41]|uniref:inorganic phosphate transporter n=1 Tax=Acidiphilium sp. 34-64-41 TaxID=1970297 RepID=UPI000BDA0FBA|nr:inorganic phosphate transporter [Acidiphilium sp. 34-64-41]OZB25624.1 MAG: inorganic phosphate transporter [Acidiphilium sp. 34-64-41]